MNQKKRTGDQYEVLDEDGTATGDVLDRETVHARELWHGVANVWVVNSRGEILLQLRAPGVELCPGVWDVAMGTHLRAGETPADAALRGIRSELGLAALPQDLKHMFNIKCANPMTNGTVHKVFGHVFLLRKDAQPGDFAVDSQKVTQLAWKPLPLLMAEIGSTEAAGRYFPRTGNYYPQLLEALQGVVSTGGVQ